MSRLDRIFKAYDVRGVVPDDLDASLARQIGAAFAIFTGAPAIVIAHDMRPSSPPLAEAFAEGACSRGTEVILAGLGSTDLLYFAAGKLDMPGAMFTASHNPAQYNGIKMCLAGAAPVGQETGLAQIRQLVEQGLPDYDGPVGSTSEQDLLGAYADYLLALVDLSTIRPLRAVVDAGNGMAGLTVPRVLRDVPVEVEEMYFELDGTFPNHEANPIDPANLVDLQRAVVASGADIGLAFDGDADRCFVVDETGAIVSPSTLTALIAARELARHPGATIIHNLITSRSVPEVIREHGGVPERTRVGHSFIKARMAETGAVFGGEHSGHFYFADFWRADSGMLAALHTLAALGGQAGPLSALLTDYQRYYDTGEINSTVGDAAAVTAAVKERYLDEGASIDELDGLTVSTAEWWFNLRPSNTEPLLRLNVEASTPEQLASVRDEVLAMVRG